MKDEEVIPETLSSSLMNATWPLAVILIRPDQSGASSFQSAALRTQVDLSVNRTVIMIISVSNPTNEMHYR